MNSFEMTYKCLSNGLMIHFLQDWDVSADPELQKVLNVARLLGRTAPAPPKAVKRVPMFNLLPTQIRCGSLP